MKTRAEKIPETTAASSRSAETQGSGDTPVPNSSHARFPRPRFRDRRGNLRTFDRIVATAPRGSVFSNAKPPRRRIHILSTMQRAIEAQERIIQTTTELKEALMHKLFTEGTGSCIG